MARGTLSIRSSAIVNFVIGGASALTGVLVARWLGPSDRGQLAVVLAWFSVALPLGELGMPIGVTYFSARHPRAVKFILMSSTWIVLGLGLFTSLVVSLLARSIDSDHSDYSALGSLMLLIPLGMISGLPSFILQSVSVSRWNFLRSLQPMLFLVFLIIWHARDSISLGSTLLVYALTLVITFVVGYIMVFFGGSQSHSLLPSSLTSGNERPKASAILRFGISSWPASIPGAISSRVDVLVLSSFVASAAVGQYAVSVTLAGISQAFVSAVAALSLPLVASLTRDPDVTQLRQLAWSSLKETLLVVVVVGGITAICVPWVVALLLGSAYPEVPTLVRFLLLAQPGAAIALVLRSLLRGAGAPSRATVPEWVSFAILLALVACLAPLAGVVGVSLAVVGSSWVAAGAYGIAWYRFLANKSALEKASPCSSS